MSAPHLGIPKAQFIEDPEKFIAQHKTVEEAINQLNQIYQKYKFMDMQIVKQKAAVAAKIPDLEASLKTIRFYRSREEDTIVNHELADGVFAKAKVPPVENVSIWLGCQVMAEYPIADAEALLEKNLAGAKRQIAEHDSNLDYLKDQTNTIEVSIARVYNANIVKNRQPTD